MPVVISGTNGVTFPDRSLQAAAASPYVLKNRIINGAMVIDQRNASTSVTINNTNAYTLDRWNVEDSTDGILSVQQVTDAPTGFYNSLKVTVTTADASLGATQWAKLLQPIEANNVTDLDFGLSTATTITVSFWVKSSLTGTFGASILNSAENRCYPFTYTISAANTWEQKSITIPGDTTGTWIRGSTAIGLRLVFGLGVGSTYSGTAGAWTSSSFIYSVTGSVNLINTLNATWQITGVQLEIGTTATPFERRLYNQELANCQRYYAKTFPQSVAVAQNSGDFNSLYTIAQVNNLSFSVTWKLPVTMRANPTVTTYSPNAANANWSPNATTPTAAVATTSQELTVINGTTSTTAGNGYYIHASASIEL